MIKGEIIVRSKISTKRLIRDLDIYIMIRQYDSFADYLTKSKKHFQKLKIDFDLSKMIIDEKAFNNFIEQINDKGNYITQNDLFFSCWVATIYKSKAPIHVFTENPALLKNNKKILNEILQGYGYVEGKPKYEIVRLKLGSL